MRCEDIVRAIERESDSKISAVESEFSRKLDLSMRDHFIELRNIEDDWIAVVSSKLLKLRSMKKGMFENRSNVDILSFKISLLEEMKQEWLESFVKSEDYRGFISDILDKYYCEGISVAGNSKDAVFVEICQSKGISFSPADIQYGVVLYGEGFVVNKDFLRIVDECFECIEGRVADELF